MSNFTKGPWVCVHAGDDGYVVQVGKDIDMVSGKGLLFMNEDKHNAHLIAAAPDMYEVLEDIVKNYECEFHIDKMIRKVLAKARGEI